MLHRYLFVAAASLMLLACSSSAELVVDLRTDLTPGIEFVSVRTEVYDLTEGRPDYDTVRIRPTEVTRGSDFREGGRIAEVGDLAAGSYLLEIALLDAREGVVASKTVRAVVEGSFGITAVITRDCRGVTCADSGGSADLTSCLAGMCVDVACVDGTEEACPDAECEADADCVSAVACAAGRCANGLCLFDEREGACPEGEWCNAEGGCQPLPGEATADCTPIVEACNTVDDDCDERVDEGFDFAIDVANCGACGNTCALDRAMPRCDAGVCVVAGCNAGYGDCDSMGTNGCEQPLDTLPHCGGCGVRCSLSNSTETCESRTCAIASCQAGYDDCNATPSDGCETDLGAADDCGSCGNACPDGEPVCAGAAPSFSCATGCPGATPTLCSGSCVDTDGDVRHCGGCDSECAPPFATPACTGGACSIESCDPGLGDCNGVTSDGCEATLTVFYRDFDRDMFGDPMRPSEPACLRPPGYVADGTDCNDEDPAVGGAMPESCNDADDDCDGLIDEGLYSVRRSLLIANPAGLRTSSEAPDVAWNGTTLGVVWTANGGGRDDLVLATAEADLASANTAAVISDQVNPARDAVIEFLNTEWLVSYTRVEGGSPQPVWGVFGPSSFPPVFEPFGPRGQVGASTVVTSGGGERLGVIMSHDLAGLRVTRISEMGGVASDGPIYATSELEHGGYGIGWDPTGHLIFGVHLGVPSSERLSLVRTTDMPAYGETGSAGPLTLSSTAGNRVFVEVSAGRMVAATSSSPGGPSFQAYVIAGPATLGGETITPIPGEHVSLGQSPSNETYGVMVDGTFRQSTFDGIQNGPAISVGVTMPHATVGGDIGPHRYVVAAATGPEGIRLFGIGCL